MRFAQFVPWPHPALIGEWVAFLQLMEERFARAADTLSLSMTRLTEHERFLAATWAAASGLRPQFSYPFLPEPADSSAGHVRLSLIPHRP